MYKIIGRPGFFIAVGVIMTVLSALMTNYFIVKNDDAIEQTLMQRMHLNKKIDQVWQESLLLEQMEEVGTTILLLYHSSETTDQHRAGKLALRRYLEKVIRTGAVDPATAKNIRSLVESGKQPMNVLSILFGIIDNHKTNAINAINELYIEQATLERQLRLIEDRNTNLRNIALFLHIMGLIFVLFSSLYTRTPLI